MSDKVMFFGNVGCRLSNKGGYRDTSIIDGSKPEKMTLSPSKELYLAKDYDFVTGVPSTTTIVLHSFYKTLYKWSKTLGGGYERTGDEVIVFLDRDVFGSTVLIAGRLVLVRFEDMLAYGVLDSGMGGNVTRLSGQDLISCAIEKLTGYRVLGLTKLKNSLISEFDMHLDLRQVLGCTEWDELFPYGIIALQEENHNNPDEVMVIAKREMAVGGLGCICTALLNVEGYKSFEDGSIGGGGIKSPKGVSIKEKSYIDDRGVCVDSALSTVPGHLYDEPIVLYCGRGMFGFETAIIGKDKGIVIVKDSGKYVMGFFGCSPNLSNANVFNENDKRFSELLDIRLGIKDIDLVSASPSILENVFRNMRGILSEGGFDACMLSSDKEKVLSVERMSSQFIVSESLLGLI